MPNGDRLQKLLKAFAQDGWDSGNPNKLTVANYQNKVGIAVQHATAQTWQGKNGKPFKKAYYVEGAPQQMGYLMGLLAEPEIAKMCSRKTIHSILKSFTGAPGRLVDGLQERMLQMSQRIKADLAGAYPNIGVEIDAMVQGCIKANPSTPVNGDVLWQLNVGFDALLAFVYTKAASDAPDLIDLFIQGKGYKLPLLCNGFSVFGGPAGARYHFMGRDFMFSTGDVMQDYIAPVIYNPEPDGILFVGISAPGMLGCFTGMNKNGVAIGVDMSPAGNCDEDHPGLNSLLLNRDAVQHGTNLQEAVQRIVAAPRGVSWIHIVADGSADSHSACIVECSKHVDNDSFKNSLMAYPPDQVKDILDRAGVINPQSIGVSRWLQTQPPSATYQEGVMVRTPDYRIPKFYLDFNEQLVDAFREATNPPAYQGISSPGDNEYAYKYNYTYHYNPKDFAAGGRLDPSLKDNDCPMSYYFPPMRNEWDDERRGNILVTTNYFMIPEMRLFQMHPDSAMIGQDEWDDMQWRYDVLIGLLSEQYDSMNHDTAKNIIDFLSPLSVFPETRRYYYETVASNRGKQPEDIEVHGAVSLMSLRERTIESKYGFYGDQWVKISLNGFRDATT
jgi:hypothetical protein